MLRVLLFCVLVAMAAAECGTLQRIKVKAQWAQAYGTGLRRQAFAQAIWRAIFARAPESRDLFDRVHGDDVNSPEFNAHALRVVGGLDMSISLLDDQDALDAQLEHLREQHIALRIPGNYFEAFGDALMQVAPAAIGRCFDSDAWESCFNSMASAIKA